MNNPKILTEIEEIAENVDQLAPPDSDGFIMSYRLDIAVQIQRNIILRERNKILKDAFLTEGSHPGALEKIAMELEKYL